MSILMSDKKVIKLPKNTFYRHFVVFSDDHMWCQNWHQYVWTSLCQFLFFVNLLHSLGVWFFDIFLTTWHLFDNWTSFDILTHYLACTLLPMCPKPLYPIVHVPIPPVIITPCAPLPLCTIAHVACTPCTPYPLYAIAPCAPMPMWAISLYPMYTIAPCTPLPMYPITPVPYWAMGHMGNGVMAYRGYGPNGKTI